MSKEQYRLVNEDDANLWIEDTETGELVELVPDDVDADEFFAQFIEKKRKQ